MNTYDNVILPQVKSTTIDNIVLLIAKQKKASLKFTAFLFNSFFMDSQKCDSMIFLAGVDIGNLKLVTCSRTCYAQCGRFPIQCSELIAPNKTP
jgi:hypothetical protein